MATYKPLPNAGNFKQIIYLCVLDFNFYYYYETYKS